MNKIYILLLALFSILQVKAQVVMGNKNDVNAISQKPDVDFEINGNIKLEKLNIDGSLDRILIANDKGKLASKHSGSGHFRATDFYSLIIPKPVSFKANEVDYVNSRSYGYTTLNLSKEVIIEPNSTVRVSLEYNIPVVVEMTDTPFPSYLGLTLFTTKEGVRTELDGGSRKYTIHNVRKDSSDDVRVLCLPITGSTVDEIVNNTNQRKIVKYEIMAYSETMDKSDATYTMYFGGYKNDLNSHAEEDQDKEHIGTGIFIINVFEQALQ